jgi:hypothetical protein
MGISDTPQLFERLLNLCTSLHGCTFPQSLLPYPLSSLHRSICAGVSTLGLSIALNAVSHHATCSVVFGFVAYFIISSVASIRKIHKLGWITWLGFGSILTAILIVVIAVTIPDRPAAAPKTGHYELGFAALPPAGTSFAGAWAASLAIFASSANTSGFVPVISEMRKPQDYFKSLYACMLFITSSYLALGLTVYAYCGQWVSSPALGSAGPTIKVISYAIAIPGTSQSPIENDIYLTRFRTHCRCNDLCTRCGKKPICPRAS